MSSEFFHWTRWILDMCLLLDTCPNLTVSNEKIYWTEALPSKKHIRLYVLKIFNTFERIHGAMKIRAHQESKSQRRIIILFWKEKPMRMMPDQLDKCLCNHSWIISMNERHASLFQSKRTITITWCGNLFLLVRWICIYLFRKRVNHSLVCLTK